ncbi:hypothetical protein NA56DRAFT_644985 [Hyaloscypha hepaticicola]|uniref:Uncharacterized protein n=1 Tax=Hyaloscypha hepaticicola TaxID=2082293 RepID=A0A2J6Q7P4_9HELO|nr:hypothetical protein NA56DRAFT_644985 [Hyaloscypha hepaticicola]
MHVLLFFHTRMLHLLLPKVGSIFLLNFIPYLLILRNTRSSSKNTGPPYLGSYISCSPSP